jgi:hypothetical protein
MSLRETQRDPNPQPFTIPTTSIDAIISARYSTVKHDWDIGVLNHANVRVGLSQEEVAMLEIIIAFGSHPPPWEPG